ncbi:type VI secretion system contractile sheath large subunit [Acidisphaera sp. L21]|uniref:type VI secretion system contractile sheath large subunit n=1 Tax=Acidisphaera sp. L21 TaxID=1641851 RepID=UPI00131E2560|nr:type VI secretion system contractile sheath large subunit [Acidisphaera sp. L21]
MDDSETIILRPGRTLPAPQPGLRDDVLGGRYFGTARAATGARLAAFLHGRGSVAELLADWFGDRLPGALRGGPDGLFAALDRDIAVIDALIGRQLDAVLHAPKVQALEGRWRGLHWFLSGIEPTRRIKVRVLPLTWAELCRDLERAPEFDQSTLFRRIYEDEFGMPGGEPFGLLVIDHAIRHRRTPDAPTDDVGALAQLSSAAAAAFSPVVLSAHPSLLELDGFDGLSTLQDVAAPFSGTEYVRWRSLATRPDTRFIAVTLPRLLARLPWGDDPARRDGFRYREYAPDPASRTWMNAAYAFAACVVRAYANHGWPADVRGVETDRVGGGLVTDVDPEPFDSGPGDVWPRTGIEARLTDRQERALVDVGLMPISALPYGPDMVFGSVRSLQLPARYQGVNAAAADANAKLSAQVNSILCASRFAHLIKVMGRDMVGSFQTADEIERKLQNWLQGYVNTNITGSGDARARFPLVAGDVQVREKPGKPGVFGCIVRLQPHYQLDDVASTFSLVTELAAPSGR